MRSGFACSLNFYLLYHLIFLERGFALLPSSSSNIHFHDGLHRHRHTTNRIPSCCANTRTALVTFTTTNLSATATSDSDEASTTSSAAVAATEDTSTISTPLAYTDTVFEEIAGRIQEHFADIPFAPAPLVTYCLKQILENMSNDLDPATLSQINEVIVAETTASEYDDFSSEQITTLSNQVAKELCDNNKSAIHLPMLSKTQEYEIIKQIVRVVFEVLTTSEEERRISWISSNLDAGKDLLSSPERRKKFAATINQVVDIPLLNEDQEESILEAALEQCATTLEQLLPPNLLSTLKGESPEGLAEMKEYMIDTVNGRVNLVGFDEQQEEEIIRNAINLLIDEYANDIETEMLLLTKPEQEKRLQEKIAELGWELEASQARFQREQANLQTQLDRIQQQLLAQQQEEA
jgi:hypothetical protein